VAEEFDRKTRKRHSRWWWIGAALLIFAGIAAVVIDIAIARAEPILKARVIETLSTRFRSRVELDGFHVSVRSGLQVSGEGLRIFAANDVDPNIHEAGIQPLIAIDEFNFTAGVLNLLHSPMHVRRVYLKGLVLNIQPKQQRTGNSPFKNGKIKIVVDEFVSDRALLVMNTLRPDKLPLEFDITSLKMNDIGPGQPMHFDAVLVNPKPIGDIQSSGLFGPWQADDPGSSPVQGNYSFDHADLSTIKGIGGILSSTGEYSGDLRNIVVDGKTDTPDFRIAISGHPVPLHTEFHAIVDGLSGNTYLKPVNAKLLNSTIIAKGSVVRVKEPKNGHQILLDVVVDPANIDDLLKLAVRTEPPIMTGKTKLKTMLEIRPGDADVTDRIHLKGNFNITGAHFDNEKIQSKLDALSMRSQGKPKLATDNIPDNVRSEMNGIFNLQSGLLTFSKLQFEVPGTNIQMTGKYSLDGNQFDFHGKARMSAHVSQMVAGWKSVLLKPADPFFSKHGAGTEIPIRVTGTKSEPHFGLDFRHKDKDEEDDSKPKK
jgi:hypothetical protein